MEVCLTNTSVEKSMNVGVFGGTDDSGMFSSGGSINNVRGRRINNGVAVRSGGGRGDSGLRCVCLYSRTFRDRVQRRLCALWS